jgi:AcrR family transcriptional regulator
MFDMAIQEKNTEEIILEAARKLFKQKGLDGTTVQDIANEAGTTKSMVNYYFRSKDKLFAAIFHQEFRNLFGGLAGFIASPLSVREKIERIVALDLEKLAQVPDLPLFILSEMNRNPSALAAVVENMPAKMLLAALDKQIADEAAQGIIRKVPAMELIITIQALTVFPFLAKPMIVNVLGVAEEDYLAMLQRRKTEVVAQIWDWIKA